MERITSSKNPLLQHVRKLQASRAYREACREFVADGFKLLNEAICWYPRLKTVLAGQEVVLPPLPDGVRVVRLSASLMQSVSNMKTPQGVIFTGELPQQMQPEPEKGMLLLDRIQDPGNLGTILRTADAFGVKVLMTNGCADAFSEKTLRASMGAVFRTPPQTIPLAQLLARCLERQLPIAATALTADAADLRQVDLKEHLVVIGSEGQGICRELLEAARQKIIIPMQPRCESLNAAVAAAIVLWKMKY